MLSKICDKINSNFRDRPYLARAAQAAVVLGAAGVNSYFFGIPSAITILASMSGLAWSMDRSRVVAAEPKKTLPILEDDEKSNIGMASVAQIDAAYQLDESSQLKGTLKLDQSVFSVPVTMDPIRIEWGDNSCFIESAVQAILNEPTLLQQLPLAIGRRLVESQMFFQPIQTLLASSELSEKQTIALLEISDAISDQPLKREHFFRVSRALRELESAGFPKGTRPKIKSLISLLEIYELIHSGKKISKQEINRLRSTLHRIHPTKFAKTGNEFGDAYEVLRTFVDLIFKGSIHDQQLITSRTISPTKGPRPLGEDRERRVQSTQPNWGFFELDIRENKGSLTAHLLKQLHSKEKYEALYFTQPGQMLKTSFQAEQTDNRFEFAPDLLLVKNGSKVPVQVDDKMTLVLDQQGKTSYQLSSVVTHIGLHCTAAVKRPNGRCFYLDDMNNKYEVVSEKALQEIAQNHGYVFVYRKIS